MVAFAPFDGQHIRPTSTRAVPAPAFDALSSAERTAYLETHPLSYALVTRSPGDGGPNHSADVDELISMGAAALARIVESDAFTTVHDDVFFLYRMTTAAHSQLGIVGLMDVADYDAGRIKCHEEVSASRVLHLSRHFERVGVQSSPIAIGYRENATIEALLSDLLSRLQPAVSFTSGDGVHQEVWVVDQRADCDAVSHAMSHSDGYIIDGHHRAAAASALHQRVGSEPTTQMLCVAFAENDLNIEPFHRRVSLASDQDPAATHAALTTLCQLQPCAFASDAVPTQAGHVGLWSNGHWWSGTLPPKSTSDPQTGASQTGVAAQANEVVAGIDAARLQDDVLRPVFGPAPELEGRLSYFQNATNLDTLASSVGLSELLFLLPAALPSQVFSVADTGGVMPPKSTYVTPKPRSGVFLRRLWPAATT